MGKNDKHVKVPTHGFTSRGVAVHGRVIDHLPTDTPYQRFNKAVALWLTSHVGSMTCFWVFLLMTLCVLPSVLYAMGVVSLKRTLSVFVLGFGFELLATWLLSTCFQLILLPGVMVGQNLQNVASDARAAKSFEDTEKIVDALDVHSQGGLKVVLDAIEAIPAQLASGTK